MKVKNISLALAFAGLGVLQQISVAQALTWNWSYTTNTAVNASGQWESDGTTYDPTATITYTIQSITGQRNGVAITGLTTTLGGDNTFKWNGTNILANSAGIEYTVASGSPNDFNPYCLGCDSSTYNLVSNEFFPGGGNGTPITSSSLSPAAAVPWDFSPTLGLALGVPLFMGSRIAKKKLASKRRTTQAVTTEAEGDRSSHDA